MSDDARSLFDGPGGIRELGRSMDWSQTPLGPVDSWSPLLQGAVQSVLRSAFPIAVHWGPDLVGIYNDAFAALIGGRHPEALGKGLKSAWPERWELIRPRIEKVTLDGVTYSAEDERTILYRN